MLGKRKGKRKEVTQPKVKNFVTTEQPIAIQSASSIPTSLEIAELLLLHEYSEKLHFQASRFIILPINFAVSLCFGEFFFNTLIWKFGEAFVDRLFTLIAASIFSSGDKQAFYTLLDNPTVLQEEEYLNLKNSLYWPNIGIQLLFFLPVSAVGYALINKFAFQKFTSVMKFMFNIHNGLPKNFRSLDQKCRKKLLIHLINEKGMEIKQKEQEILSLSEITISRSKTNIEYYSERFNDKTFFMRAFTLLITICKFISIFLPNVYVSLALTEIPLEFLILFTVGIPLIYLFFEGNLRINNEQVKKENNLQLTQLKKITPLFEKHWSLLEMSSLEKSCHILNLSRMEIKYRETPIPRYEILKIFKKLFLEYKCTILVYDSNNGIIISRENVFSDAETAKMREGFKDKLQELTSRLEKINKLKEQLNILTGYLISPKESELKSEPQDHTVISWAYYEEDNCLALNLNNCTESSNKIQQQLSFLTPEYKEKSGYLIIRNLNPINKFHFTQMQEFHNPQKPLNPPSRVSKSNDSRLISQQHNNSSNLYVKNNKKVTPKSEFSVYEKPKSSSKKSFSKSKPFEFYDKSALSSKKSPNQVKQDLVSEVLLDISTQKFPISAPNLFRRTHFSRYTVENTGIMMEKCSKKHTFYSKFFALIKDGRMGFHGNSIKKLNKPKEIFGLFGKTIVATHKLAIKKQDMRIFGILEKEGEENVITFSTVQLRHKWADR